MDTGSLEYNVIVVKWGDKFTAEHVNRLYRMAKRNITLPFNFYCYTEDATDIYDEVNIIQLDESLDLKAWWWKLTIFKENSLKGINVFFDLDVVIQNNIDHFFEKAQHNKIILISPILGDFPSVEADIKTVSFYNSSIMVWYNNDHIGLYEKFINNYKLYTNLYLGIDRFFSYELDQNYFEHIGDDEYYHRDFMEGDKYQFQHVTRKIPNGKQIRRVYYNPDIPVCVFNGCHEEYFYQGMEKYLV